MGKKLRVAIIGTGGISRMHARAWLRSRLATLVAAADIQRHNLRGFCAEFGLTPEAAFADPRRLLRSVRPDCVSICTWAQHHAELAVAAARAGVRGILCEKPLGYSMREAQAMARASARHGAKIMITHQRRYHADITRARTLLRRGAIGKVQQVIAWGGGGLTNTHTHFVDLVRYLLGDPPTEWVMAQVERTTNRHERCYPIEDRAVGTIGFAGGAVGTILSDLPSPHEPSSGLRVYGSAGAMDIFAGPLLMNRATDGKWEKIAVKRWVDPCLAYVRDLVRWLEGGPEPRISLRKAMATQEILMAFYESARTRSLVRLPLRNKGRLLEAMVRQGAWKLTRRKPYDIRTAAAFKAGYR